MEEGDYRASHTAPSPLTLTLHLHPSQSITHCILTHCINTHTHTHMSPTLEVCEWEGEWVGREVAVSCPYFDLHLDLQVSPVDGEQCAVRAGGAQLPGAVGHVPVVVSQEDQWGEGGDLAGEGYTHLQGRGGEGTAFHLHTHSHLTHILSMV